MDEIEAKLADWGNSLLPQIPVGGLLARNKIAYKWKALFRVWMLRELVLWREHDLMVQSYALHSQGHGLGARVLLRCGFETLGTLTYLNLLIEKVIRGDLSFHSFDEKTTRLLAGGRNDEEYPSAINILTVLEKCDKRYPGILMIYEGLSESAHPNFEGLMGAYSDIDHEEYEAILSNRWMELHGDRHPNSMLLCIETFQYEYNEIWPKLMVDLERWVEENNDILERTKDDPLPV